MRYLQQYVAEHGMTPYYAGSSFEEALTQNVSKITTIFKRVGFDITKELSE